MDRGLPAIEGGSPVRSSFLPFSKPELGLEEERAVIDVLRSGWIGSGPRTQLFEERFAANLGVRHAVAVSSCTAGLHLLLRAFGIGQGDEVVTSAMTFPATANAVLHAGAKPVLADVIGDRLTLDPAAARAAITRRTRALIVVHFAGWPCQMDELGSVARGAGIVLIEDASHALGATYRGRAVGALGDAAAFSFYATKSITTAEGGMITTNRTDLIPRLRRERLHGIDLDASQRMDDDYRHWESISLGWKYNMTDLSAALGLAQLEKLPSFLARRRALERRYRTRLAEVDGIVPLGGTPDAETAAHLFPVLLRPGALRIDRDAFLKALLAENIGVGVHFRALPLHRHFREVLRVSGEAVPVATDASHRILSLPLYPGMTDRDQDDVITALVRLTKFYRA